MAFTNETTPWVTDVSPLNTTTETNTFGNLKNVTRSSTLGGNNAGFLSDSTTEDFTFAIQCITIPILVVIGIIGNVLSLVVLSSGKLRRSSTTVLLIGLAISDTLYLVSTMIRKSSCIIKRFDAVLSYKYFVFSFSSMFYLNTCFSKISTLLVTIISLERLAAVLFPLKIRLFSTKIKMIVAVISVFIFTFACLALLPAQYTIRYRNNMPFLQVNTFYKENKEFIDIYNTYLTGAVFRWLPKAIVVACNASIITLLWRRRIPAENQQAVQAAENYSKTQRRITTMLVTVAVVFIVTLLPGDIFLIATMLVDEFGLYQTYNNLFVVLSDVTVTFEIINSSINFIIYMVINSTFSEVYLVLFCPCMLRNTGLVRSSSSTQCTRSYAYSRDQNKHRISESSSSIGMVPSISTSLSYNVDKLTTT